MKSNVRRTGNLMMTDKAKGWQNHVATGAVAMIRRRPRHSRTRKWGYSLVEMIITMMVVGVLISMGIPRFQQSVEQARANVAGANLQAIWSAQRLFWLQNRTYAIDVHTPLDTLQAANPSFPLIDPALTTTTASYTYTVTGPVDGSTFTATATRNGTSGWSGAWTIDQNGQTGGAILQAGQPSNIVLGFQ
jgi:prepilin-type N-terminal cleavage/methylation domain-containing protein